MRDGHIWLSQMVMACNGEIWQPHTSLTYGDYIRWLFWRSDRVTPFDDQRWWASFSFVHNKSKVISVSCSNFDQVAIWSHESNGWENKHQETSRFQGLSFLLADFLSTGRKVGQWWNLRFINSLLEWSLIWQLVSQARWVTSCERRNQWLAISPLRGWLTMPIRSDSDCSCSGLHEALFLFVCRKPSLLL